MSRGRHIATTAQKALSRLPVHAKYPGASLARGGLIPMSGKILYKGRPLSLVGLRPMELQERLEQLSADLTMVPEGHPATKLPSITPRRRKQ